MLKQRKLPNSMDAWDLVMRALSHYWRVTRQDGVVAQARCWRRRPRSDPNYGQALGVLATKRYAIQCPHGMGRRRDDNADRRARCAGRDPG